MINQAQPQRKRQRVDGRNMFFGLSSWMIAVALLAVSFLSLVEAFSVSTVTVTVSSCPRNAASLLQASSKGDWSDPEADPNRWRPSDEIAGDDPASLDSLENDWQAQLRAKKDGSFWKTFESVEDDESAMASLLNGTGDGAEEEIVDESEAWLDTLASLQAEEIEFNLKEADRADKVRQMQDMGMSTTAISNTLDVAIDTSLEKDGQIDGFQSFQEEAYYDDVDWRKVESHTKVEVDPETKEPTRQQMVYVDEHTCIGCTNCAMIAQSTFLMDDEHGRARVFQQWGDDEETIQVAIETCPVDCIHYVPYDELKRLEVDRRGQNINFKARLVSQGEYTSSLSHAVGGANAFTAPQQISGNMGSRCNNCPTRGCRTCPMFGVGKNPEFERKEKERKLRIERRRVEEERENSKKSIDL